MSLKINEKGVGASKIEPVLGVKTVKNGEQYACMYFEGARSRAMSSGVTLNVLYDMLDIGKYLAENKATLSDLIENLKAFQTKSFGKDVK